MNACKLGEQIKSQRKRLNLTQEEVAGLCGVSTYFLSFLENGKDSAELGKVLQVLEGIGLSLIIEENSWKSKNQD